MKRLARISLSIALPLFLFCLTSLRAQDAEPSVEPVRVMVMINPDGSRTSYECDLANHKAIATTTERDGKLRGKIRYTLDDKGRFATGEIYGPNDQFRFNAIYKYDSAGRLSEEAQSERNGTFLHKIVYSYDAVGRQTSYSVYDAAGKLVRQTAASTPTTTPGKEKHRPR